MRSLEETTWGKGEIQRLIAACVIGLGVLMAGDARAADDDEGDVPYVPTPQNVVDKMLEMADVSSNDIIYDLGCGDGRIVITAAKKYGARGVGVDIDPDRIAESRKNARQAGVTNLVSFREQDLFKTDLSEATVVTLYLLPDVNTKLRPKLLEQLEPGSRVVSHSFDMDEWEADEKRRIVEKNGSTQFVDAGDLSSDYGVSFESDANQENLPEGRDITSNLGVGDSTWKATLYKWVIPADFEGTWTWTNGSSSGKKTYGAVLRQDFQRLQGQVVTPDQRQLKLSNGLIQGYELDFRVRQGLGGGGAPVRFYGMLNPGEQVIEGRIVGRERQGNGQDTNAWRAIRLAPEQ